MKILHINDNYCNLGGAEKYLLDICNALEEVGNQVVVISSSKRNHISVKGRTEYFVDSSYGVRSALRIWKAYKHIVKKEKPDIIHLHNTHYFISPLIINRLWKMMPIVKFVHDVRFFCPSGRKIISATNEICRCSVGINCFKQKGCYPFQMGGGSIFHNLHKFFFVSYELRVSRLLDKIIVGSRYMADELIRNSFLPDKISVIPCYTDMVPNTYKYQVEKSLILCVGRFDGVKGIPQFIEALNHLKDREWQAEIVGDGEFMKESHERVEKLGMEKRIKFHGRISKDEIERCYSRCSMVVLPSMIPESFGLVGIEAMSFCKPVVAFDSGGIREWLVDGDTGFLVKRGDIAGIAERISILLNDDMLAKKMGERGKERVEEYYRKEIHIKKLNAVYEEAIRMRSHKK